MSRSSPQPRAIMTTGGSAKHRVGQSSDGKPIQGLNDIQNINIESNEMLGKTESEAIIG